MVTLCLPTVRCVPGGSVPAGTLRAVAAAGAETAVSEVALDRLAMDELCDEKGDAMATVIDGHRQELERGRTCVHLFVRRRISPLRVPFALL